jgi:hypothetical protein
MLSSGANVIIWDEMLYSGMKCYQLGWNVVIWEAILSSGTVKKTRLRKIIHNY